MEPKTIVAIEIASSKIKGAVGAVASDGRVAVLAVEELPATDNVRYGRVQNIREVTAAVSDILHRLEESPAVAPRKITAAAVALGGRSLSGQIAKAALKFPRECEITEKHVQRLAYEAAHDFVGDRCVVDTVPRMYYVNNAAVRQPAGIFGENLRGEFLMLTCGRETKQNLERLRFGDIEPEGVEFVIRPTAIADLVLSADEKELGTALVDFGAETTTLTVYKEGSPAFVCTIPMGSRLITLDLTQGLAVTEEAAENIKRSLASAPEGGDDLARGYANSRAGEIAANVLNQLELAGFGNGTLSKIVVTGTASKLPYFASQLAAQSKTPVRNAEMPAEITFRIAGRNNADNIDIVALLLAGSRRFVDGCVEKLEEAEVADVKDEPGEIRTVVVEDEVEDDEPVAVPYDDDDDSILADDPDDPEPEEEDKNRRGGFSLFGFKKKDRSREQAKAVREPEPEPEPEEVDDEPETEEDPDNFSATKDRLESIRNRFIKIFTPPEEYNDEPEEDE